MLPSMCAPAVQGEVNRTWELGTPLEKNAAQDMWSKAVAYAKREVAGGVFFDVMDALRVAAWEAALTHHNMEVLQELEQGHYM